MCNQLLSAVASRDTDDTQLIALGPGIPRRNNFCTDDKRSRRCASLVRLWNAFNAFDKAMRGLNGFFG